MDVYSQIASGLNYHKIYLMVDCKICGSTMSEIFDCTVMGKYKVLYFQCSSCLFIQTEEPFWLNEAYSSAMTALDVGLISRNIEFSNSVPQLLELFSLENNSYLDYGGGYGMFVRMMRDKGYDFFLFDIYAENIYAKYFDINHYHGKEKFTCLTAFEVFEHLVSPRKELDEMFRLSDTIIFSTELQPQSIKNEKDWWYFVPEVGQHVSLYSYKSLLFLADLYNCSLYSNKQNLHILTKHPLEVDPFNIIEKKSNRLYNGISRLLKGSRTQIKQSSKHRSSLLQLDFELYKEKLKNTFSSKEKM
jgi:hypothetical protein